MAEQLSNLGGALQGRVQGAWSKGQSMVDTRFPPDKRADVWARMQQFARERPKLAAFILAHVALSGIPLGVFLVTTLSVAIFSISTALLLGLLGAGLFIAFTVGAALIVLLPTLFFTTMAATCVFLWGMAAYALVTWFNERRTPRVHANLAQGWKGEYEAVGNVSNGKSDASGLVTQNGNETNNQASLPVQRPSETKSNGRDYTSKREDSITKDWEKSGTRIHTVEVDDMHITAPLPGTHGVAEGLSVG